MLAHIHGYGHVALFGQHRRETFIDGRFIVDGVPVAPVTVNADDSRPVTNVPKQAFVLCRFLRTCPKNETAGRVRVTVLRNTKLIFDRC